MKKPTKSSLKKKLDKEFSRVIRLRERCARCSKSENLQCAHIFSRRNLAVRWDLDNAIPLCYACHIHWAHKEPILFYELVRNYLGEYKLNELQHRATMIKKWTIIEMAGLLKQLQAL